MIVAFAGCHLLRVVLVIFPLLCLALGIGGFWLAQRSLPVLDGVVTLEPLLHSSVVKYDTRGVPYIETSSDRDMWMVQGFVTACDRLFQMDMLRRTANGETAELFGPTALEQDKLMRTIGFNRMARAELPKLPAQVRSNLDAYCLGVNACIKGARSRMPLEFFLLGYEPRAWEPEDTLSILRYLQYQHDESWRIDELRQQVLEKTDEKVALRLFNEQFIKVKSASISAVPSHPAATCRDANTSILLGKCGELMRKCYFAGAPDPRWGSNAWAVAGSLSDSGGCMLAGDKHDQLTSPDLWYLCSLQSPSTKVAGVTIPGVPGVIYGRNRQIAWSGNNLKCDSQDLYLEQFSPQFPGKYRTAEGWKNVEEITEDIKVRLGRNVVHKVLSTAHGPVLLKNDNTAIALHWIGSEVPSKSILETIWQLDQADDFNAFRNALQSYSGSAQSFVYADKKGNIGVKVAGRIPQRQTGITGSLLVQGWTIKSSPSSVVANLPESYNPREGYVVGGFQQIAGAQNIQTAYPPFRISTVLSSFKSNNQKPGMPEMAVLQFDQLSLVSTLARKELRKAIDKNQLIDRYQLSAMELLDHWDGQLSSNSPAASMHEAYIREMAHRILEPKLGPQLTDDYMNQWPRWSSFIEQILREKPPDWLPPEERTYDTFFVTTFSQALKKLKIEYKSDDPKKWIWQGTHRATFKHPMSRIPGALASAAATVFNTGPVGVGGDQDCVNACNVVASPERFSFVSDTGPCERMLIDMSDGDKFYGNLTLGQSGQLISTYRTDQLRSWLNAEQHSVAFSENQIDRQMQHKLILTNQ